MDMRALAVLTTLAIVGCDAPQQQDAQPPPPHVEQPRPPKADVIPEKPPTTNKFNPTEALLLKIQSESCLKLEQELQAKGALTADSGLTLSAVQLPPKDPTKRFTEAMGRLLYLETQFESKLAELNHSPFVENKTLKVGRRKMVFPPDIIELKKARCKRLGQDDLICKITFKLLKRTRLLFQLEDKDGVNLNYPTVGIPSRTPVGVLTKQEIIIPRDTVTLTFIES